jgi:F-box/leucine-rich repeat protein 2/20
MINIAERCPNLEELVLSHCEKITDVSSIAKSCPKLHSLDLSMCNGIIVNCLTNISKWSHNLRILDVSRCSNVCEFAVMNILGGCLKLESLTTYKCHHIRDDSKKRIAERFPNLKSSLKWENWAAEMEYDQFMFEYLEGDHGDH